MSNICYHILNSDDKLAGLTNQLITILSNTAEEAVVLTEAVAVDVVVRHDPQQTIPELGIAGQYTKAARCIDIYLDLNNSYLKQNLIAEVTRTFSHEYMHVVREEHIPWENGTLLESLIAEGLAQSFELEVQPNLSPSIYATACTTEQLVHLWDQAQPFLQKRGTANDDWFFGNDTIPHWAGYSLGFKLIQDKTFWSSLKASKLYTLPAVDFLQ